MTSRTFTMIVAPLPEGKGSLIIHWSEGTCQVFADHPSRGLIELSPEFLSRKSHILDALREMVSRKLDRAGVEVAFYEL